MSGTVWRSAESSVESRIGPWGWVRPSLNPKIGKTIFGVECRVYVMSGRKEFLEHSRRLDPILHFVSSCRSGQCLELIYAHSQFQSARLKRRVRNFAWQCGADLFHARRRRRDDFVFVERVGVGSVRAIIALEAGQDYYRLLPVITNRLCELA